MEKFDINLDGKILNVTAQDDGNYLVMESGIKLGTLVPELSDLGVQWTTVDLMAPNYVMQIGELIEEHDL